MSLTAERLRTELGYSPETGEWVWRVARKGTPLGKRAGALNSAGYMRIGIDQRDYMAHRLAWLYVTGEWPSAQIDHINGVRTDNRFANLRVVPCRVNNQNIRSAKRTSATGLLGASAAKKVGSFRACICVDGRNKHLGNYQTKEEAHAAYINAKRKFHEGCTI